MCDCSLWKKGEKNAKIERKKKEKKKGEKKEEKKTVYVKRKRTTNCINN